MFDNTQEEEELLISDSDDDDLDELPIPRRLLSDWFKGIEDVAV